jgi:peptide/nickel transport system substrate-binding protein
VEKNTTSIKIPREITEKLNAGANDLKIFAISDSVLKPDYYSTSFLTVKNKTSLPQISQTNINFDKNKAIEIIWFTVPLVIIIIIIIYARKRKSSKR